MIEILLIIIAIFLLTNIAISLKNLSTLKDSSTHDLGEKITASFEKRLDLVEVAIRDILNKYPQLVVFDMWSELIPEYVRDWEDEFEDVYEAYEEQGRGEAENAVLDKIIDEYVRAANVTLSIDEWNIVYNELKEEWEL